MPDVPRKAIRSGTIPSFEPRHPAREVAKLLTRDCDTIKLDAIADPVERRERQLVATVRKHQANSELKDDVLDQKLDYILKQNEEQKEQNSEVLVQVQTTNGRVNKLEDEAQKVASRHASEDMELKLKERVKQELKAEHEAQELLRKAAREADERESEGNRKRKQLIERIVWGGIGTSVTAVLGAIALWVWGAVIHEAKIELQTTTTTSTDTTTTSRPSAPAVPATPAPSQYALPGHPN